MATSNVIKEINDLVFRPVCGYFVAMNWNPKYTITHKLVATIREIGEAIGEIRGYPFSAPALAELEVAARELSSFASTSIEGNPLALTDVRRLLKHGKKHIRDTEKEVLNYNRALQHIYDLVTSENFNVNIKTLQSIQKLVVEGLMDNPAHIGRVRQDSVVIRDPGTPDSIVFIPPDAVDVKSLLTGLFRFIENHKKEIDPIILAGLFHRQCVIIHPFMDGNGRTNRLVTTALLGANGLNLFNIYSFENYYNQNITRYFQKVGLRGDYYEIAEYIDHTEWLEYFTDGILDELSRIRKTLSIEAAEIPRLESHHKQVLNYIQQHGSISQREYGQISSRSLAARKLDFDKLKNLGLIESRGTGRGIYYVAANQKRS